MHTPEKLYYFLKKVDTTFPVPLSKKQDLQELSNKFCEKGLVLTKKDDTSSEIVALVAGYIENTPNQLGYISVVTTLPEARGRGYARVLVQEFMEKAKNCGLNGVHLYTVETNTAAVRLYESLGFQKYISENETRPDDLHLIYWF